MAVVIKKIKANQSVLLDDGKTTIKFFTSTYRTCGKAKKRTLVVIKRDDFIGKIEILKENNDEGSTGH